MLAAEADYADYLLEIRKRVRSRCVEHAAGWPSLCTAGKELWRGNAPAGVDRFRSSGPHEVAGTVSRTPSTGDLRKMRFLHSRICPCPMDYLAELIVEAVEAVDRRRASKAGPSREASPKDIYLQMDPWAAFCVRSGVVWRSWGTSIIRQRLRRERHPQGVYHGDHVNHFLHDRPGDGREIAHGGDSHPDQAQRHPAERTCRTIAAGGG